MSYYFRCCRRARKEPSFIANNHKPGEMDYKQSTNFYPFKEDQTVDSHSTDVEAHVSIKKSINDTAF
jgi:hypothetical protein